MNLIEFKQKGLLNQLNMMLFHPCRAAIEVDKNSFQFVDFRKQAPNGINMESEKGMEKTLYAVSLLSLLVEMIKEEELIEKTSNINTNLFFDPKPFLSKCISEWARG
ncbi:MAG: hypothetical protein GY760_14165 [Deltaproteobacteria bacterium]|nr:hypothetical protein [Deltaproteobacteria bacterium]